MDTHNLKCFRKYYPNGILKYEAYENEKGIQEGLVVQYYPNGSKEREVYMSNGMFHGEIRSWDFEGNLLDSYLNSNGNGPFRTWYGNGKKKAEGQIKNGLFVGKLILWDEDGNISSVTYHIKGAEVKKEKYLKALLGDPTLPPPRLMVVLCRPHKCSNVSTRATHL